MAMPWYQRLFDQPKSKEVAKERLQLVLLHDRKDLSPDLMDRIKEDIIAILSQYVEINYAAMDIELTRANQLGCEVSAFVANIPIKGVKMGQRARW